MSLADWELEVEQWELEFEQGAAPVSSDPSSAAAPPTIREPDADRGTRRATLASAPPLCPAPPSTDVERFDLRTTTKQLVVIVQDDVDEDDSPTAAREPSKLDIEPVELTSRAPSSIPPPPPPPHLPSLAPVSLSSTPSSDRGHDELEQEVRHLRRRMQWTNRLSMVAVGCCLVLGIKLWGASKPEAEALQEPARIAAPAVPPAPRAEPSAAPSSPARQGVEVRSAQPGVRLFVDDRERGTLPLVLDDLSTGDHRLRFEGAAGQEPLTRTVTVRAGEITDLGTVTLSAGTPAGRIEVKVRVLTPGATVCIAPHGGAARTLAGPFPRTLLLRPGSYALLVSKGERRTTVPLFLPVDQPTREVVVRLE